MQGGKTVLGARLRIGDARSAAVVFQPEGVHRAEGLAQREDALHERVKVA